ncbi:putative methyl-accepting chemotaxis protein YoaH [Clostridium saccharobutylicum]|uniref:methyl-accepting chemotaxis protein n=1 Tax=Clostridium saccharobutylicum TaxID=169679 RepID=UPI000983BE00|nr:methyl-accepting chemotaxis protein [Clostridium saccharobutylicum]AQS09917.1 putative methyl-accepting chemotaxis protein YoaH [Clostridium saccharobutylicum]MBC2438527.1 methyl-accepting chemotaxis protein [Clostridium saccharobutylicum]NSB90893.1 methyl-accepting chemotaxis protein [Clostridium saccharobutylicum]NYC27674.1 methyl-accepting chemotaxis protein [Clostridium saccharobutylicum]OOM12375.1 putative methyl-accepting chemotaxis protein YoaH [Clostridium saccharobutylicum]
MGLLKNLRVKTKLLGAFLIVALLIGIVGTIGVISLRNIGENAKVIYNQNLRVVYILTDMKENLSEIKSDILQMVYVRDSSRKPELKKNIEENKAENNDYIREFESFPLSGDEKNVFETFNNNLNQYKTLRENIIKLVDDENFDEAEKQYVQASKVRIAMFDNLNKLIEINLNDAELADNNINSIYIKAKSIMLLLSIAGLILAIIIGLILSNDINKPLQIIKLFGEKLANYDLSYEFKVTRGDEFGQTGEYLFKAQNNIKKLVKTIIENSQNMSASSEELSATVEELSSKALSIDEAVKNITSNMQESSAGTEEISASIQEVDSSMNILSQKAMDGSNSSNVSKEKATEVKNISQKAIEESKNIFTEKQEKMIKVIEDGKIVDTIKVMADTIASIAEQTNLLALNAAIEAARAGEQGKGFAVVAEEVRTLAEQSADAVQSIQETISKVQGAFKNSIDTGNDILEFINKNVQEQFSSYQKTGNQYYNDADFISKVTEDIATMSEEVTATVDQVSDAVQDMAQTAQQSSEEAEMIKESINETTQAIEQVALTAQSQAELAQTLNEIIQKFKI